MDSRFIQLFEQELTHVRRMTEEFKHAHPQVADRLQLGQDPPDPYVQQLLDGFAFLAARVQLKLDSEFPKFIESLLETIYPHYLAPVPAMGIASFEPDYDNGELATGPLVPRGTTLSSTLMPGDPVRCRFTTAHDFQLFPIRLVEARYFEKDLAEIDAANQSWAKQTGARAAIRIRLQATAGLTFDKIAAEKLVLHLRPLEDMAGILYEQLLAHCSAVVIQPAARPVRSFEVLSPAPLRAMGFEDNEALLPPGARTFSGYRALQEYFAFPSRYFFVELSGLRQALRQCATNQVDVIFCLKDPDVRLERRVSADCLALYCVPIINLFPMDNIVVSLKDQREEQLVVPDRTRILEYEVYSIERILGRACGATKPDEKYEFLPFYFSPDREAEAAGFFTTRRVRRNLTDLELRHQPVSEYLGSDLYLSLSGGMVKAIVRQLDALHVRALCTNRHLPMRHSELQFDCDLGPPIASIRTVAKTPPRTSHLEGRLLWRVVSHLALNYRSLLAGEGETGAAALQELLRLYVPDERDAVAAQIRALKKAKAQPIFRRVSDSGPIAYARGLAIGLEFDEKPFNEAVFLLATVLNRFFSRYVTLNSFVQTELSTQQRGRIFQWPILKGVRQLV